MKDAVATMGNLLPDDAGGRDAVHVAVISAVAGGILAPGMDVGFDTMPTASAEGIAGVLAELIGIVDPFLKKPVQRGQRFWLYLYPRTITGLNHQWTHPALPDAKAGSIYNTPSQKLASEQWLRDFCARSDCPGYDEVMKLIRDGDYSDDDNDISGRYEHDYLHFGGRDAHGEIPPEFWTNAEIVLGRELKKRPEYFSCSC